MCKKLISVFIAAIMLLMIIPVSASAVGSFVSINGIELTDGVYWKNGDTSVATGTADDYNAYFSSEDATLVLKDAEITYGYYDSENDIFAGIYADVDNLALVLKGENKIDLSNIEHNDIYAVYSNKSLAVRSGSLEIDIKSEKASAVTGIFTGADFSSSDVKFDIDVSSSDGYGRGINCSDNMLSFNGTEALIVSDSDGVSAENINIQNAKYDIISEVSGLTAYSNLVINEADVNVIVKANGEEISGVGFGVSLELSFGAKLYSVLETGDDYKEKIFLTLGSLPNAEWNYGGMVLPINGAFDYFGDAKVVVNPDGTIAKEVKLTAELCNAAIETDPTVVELDDAIEPVEITVKNVGNVDLELLQPTSEFYKVSELSETELAPGETATFTVAPIKDADAFEYIEIKTNYGTSTRVQVTYTIFDDYDSDHAGDEFENEELPSDPVIGKPDETVTEEITEVTAPESTTTDCPTYLYDENTEEYEDESEHIVKTGVKHNWVLPVVLICVAILVIVVLIVTKKKSDK